MDHFRRISWLWQMRGLHSFAARFEYPLHCLKDCLWLCSSSANCCSTRRETETLSWISSDDSRELLELRCPCVSSDLPDRLYHLNFVNVGESLISSRHCSVPVDSNLLMPLCLSGSWTLTKKNSILHQSHAYCLAKEFDYSTSGVAWRSLHRDWCRILDTAQAQLLDWSVTPGLASMSLPWPTDCLILSSSFWLAYPATPFSPAFLASPAESLAPVSSLRCSSASRGPVTGSSHLIFATR